MKIGIGYDVHRLVEDRDMILGGVKIESSQGILGHSDADVLLHAISDAILGACGENDIGTHFPDKDIKYKDISSLKILEKVNEILKSKEYEVSNVDSVISLERPKLCSYINEMKKNISEVLGIHKDSVNIKATTTEGLSFEGKGEGITARAVVLVVKTIK